MSKALETAIAMCRHCSEEITTGSRPAHELCPKHWDWLQVEIEEAKKAALEITKPDGGEGLGDELIEL